MTKGFVVLEYSTEDVPRGGPVCDLTICIINLAADSWVYKNTISFPVPNCGQAKDNVLHFLLSHWL